MDGRLRPRDIIAARTQAGLSQSQFAALFAVAQTTVSRWEIGIQKPNISQQIKLHKFFDEVRSTKSVEGIVIHSPFTMALMTRNWTFLAASPALAEFNGTAIPALRGLNLKKMATVEMEQMVSSLDAFGFFRGTTHSFRVIGRGVLVDGRPCAFDTTTTPISLDGEIVMMNQITFIEDKEYSALRRNADLVTLLV
jgi:transcriptional regulator with XRE-family HTH domain